MTYSMQIGRCKLIFSDTHFKDFRKKPTISVYDADNNSETKIASFNSQEVFEWFINQVAEQTEPSTEDCSMVDCKYYKNPDYQRCMECKRKQTDCPWK